MRNVESDAHVAGDIENAIEAYLTEAGHAGSLDGALSACFSGNQHVSADELDCAIATYHRLTL